MFSEGSYFQEEIAIIGDQAKFEARVPGPSGFGLEIRNGEAEVTFSPREPKGPVTQTVEVDATHLAQEIIMDRPFTSIKSFSMPSDLEPPSK